jgi:hypothetical protein
MARCQPSPIGVESPRNKGRHRAEWTPNSAFVAGASSWKSLTEELERDQGRPPSGTEFKRWLARRGTKFSEANIRQAAKSISAPDELIKHLNRMSETIHRP